MGQGGSRSTSHRTRNGGGSSSGSIKSVNQDWTNREVQTKLTDFISEKGVDSLRKVVSVYDPTLGNFIKVAEFIYRNRHELTEAVSQISHTWSTNQTLEDKIMDTANTFVNTSATIIKNETKGKLSEIVAKTVASTAVEVLDHEQIFDKVDEALKIPYAGDHFKDLLEDTIRKETKASLDGILGDNNDK